MKKKLFPKSIHLLYANSCGNCATILFGAILLTFWKQKVCINMEIHKNIHGKTHFKDIKSHGTEVLPFKAVLGIIRSAGYCGPFSVLFNFVI